MSNEALCKRIFFEVFGYKPVEPGDEYAEKHRFSYKGRDGSYTGLDIPPTYDYDMNEAMGLIEKAGTYFGDFALRQVGEHWAASFSDRTRGVSRRPEEAICEAFLSAALSKKVQWDGENWVPV